MVCCFASDPVASNADYIKLLAFSPKVHHMCSLTSDSGEKLLEKFNAINPETQAQLHPTETECFT